MMNARAPARALGHMQLRRSAQTSADYKSFELKYPNDSMNQLEVLNAVKRALPDLSPATRRMLETVRLALTIEGDRARGYRFRGAVSRAKIAATLQKDRLVPYDVEKLNKLVAAHLMTEDYHALPVMTAHGADGQALQYGAGGEYIYHIPPMIMYALMVIDNPSVFADVKQARKQADQAELERLYSDEQLVAVAEPVAEPRRLIARSTGRRRRWLGMTTRQVIALGVLALLLLGVLALVVWALLMH